MRKKIIFILALMILIPMNVSAKTKTQTIYSYIDYEGKVSKSIVNNHLYRNESNQIKDETLLEDIINLNGEEGYKKEENRLVWDNGDNDIYYQGTTKEDLPLSIRPIYSFNGEEINNPKDIIGKSGDIKIELRFFNNSLLRKDGLYTPLAVIVATNLKNTNDKNISIKNGKTIDTGNTTYLIGACSPGLTKYMDISQSNYDTITIEYETKSFSLNEFYIIASPNFLEDLDLSFFDKLAKLTDALENLKMNMDILENGAKTLEEGTNSLYSGVEGLTSSINALKIAMEGLKSGSIQLNSGVNEILNSLANTSNLLDNPKLNESIKQIIEIKNKNTDMINKLDPVADQEIITLLAMNNNAYDEILNLVTELKALVEQEYNKLKSALINVEKATDSLKEGLIKTTDGTNALFKGVNVLEKGSLNMKEGSKNLSEGITKINKEGIKVLHQEIIRYNDYGKKVKSLINLSKGYNGFGCTNADATTFIYKIG